MRIQLLSDLHLELHPEFLPQHAADVDVLVLAGDIGSYQTGSLLTGSDFGLERFSPKRPASPWPRVLFTPGNHEFDGLEFADTYVRLRQLCQNLGIEWLEQEIITIGSVRFVGTTLWSDFDAFAKAEKSVTRQLQQREKAFRAANYYLSKNTTLHQGQPMLADAMREVSLGCQAWLSGALLTPFAGTTVVVTHFAPTLQSADPRYGQQPGTAGFCNALDELLPFAQVWMHGHLHCAHNYTVRGNQDGHEFACQVVANPLGYLHKGEQASFVEGFVVDVPG
ncbi:MAG: metallophosphoesterase [Rhodoferax sp.]|nr:metallophosphoesterase [Rhodoferax sp.]